ncbi:MAG: hypothetical protein LBI02_02130 [Opitutaceae bacterium]|nr:hypothetical protein [Opitutaceae bacterium]
MQPLGVFKRERTARYARVLKVGSRFVAKKGAREKLVPWVHKDWNCPKRTRLKTEEQKRAEKACLEARKKRKERIAEMHANARFRALLESRERLKGKQGILGETPENAPGTAGELPEPMGQNRKAVIRNRIFARLVSVPYFGRTWEPAALVWNYQSERKREVLAERHGWPWIGDAVEVVRDIVAKARQLKADERLAEMRAAAGGSQIGYSRLDRNCPAAAGPSRGDFDPLSGSFADLARQKKKGFA